jgi:hypothetical protein
MQCNTLYYQPRFSNQFNKSFNLEKSTMDKPENSDEMHAESPALDQGFNQGVNPSLSLEIEQLRAQFPHTQDLYREVCVLMFFRHGTTPTANKLYQLVRKGSMSAPAEALAAFWENLREKSRVRIEHPDLPQALKTAAGELTATLWASARQLANDTLAASRLEAQQAVDAAGAALSAMQRERDAIALRLQDQASINAQALHRIDALEQDASASAAINLAQTAQRRQASEQAQQLKEQLQQSKEQSKEQLQQAREQAMAHQIAEQQAQQQQLQDARREFTADLDKLRAANQLADERSLAVETRALLEIDRERTIAARLQKERDAERAAAMQADLRHRKDVAALQTQIGDQKQQGGVLQGHLQAAIDHRDAMALELTLAREQAATAATEITSMRLASESWQRQWEEAQRLLAEPRLAASLTRAQRKPKG